jgi:CDP-glycerol glycerophosphotransferase (TagB/SpsB family)
LELANRYDDLFLILKPKVDHISGQEFDSLIQSVLPEGTDRVAVEKELDTYEMFPISDYMVVTYVSTIGLEGIMADKKVLFFDVSESNQDLVYGSYDENLVSFSKEEFWKSAHWLLEEGCYVPQPVLEKIVRLHGLCFDGKVTRRFKDAVLSAYSSSRETL